MASSHSKGNAPKDVSAQVCLDLFKVFFVAFYHGRSPFAPPFGEYVFTFSKHLKQIQFYRNALGTVDG